MVNADGWMCCVRECWRIRESDKATCELHVSISDEALIEHIKSIIAQHRIGKADAGDQERREMYELEISWLKHVRYQARLRLENRRILAQSYGPAQPVHDSEELDRSVYLKLKERFEPTPKTESDKPNERVIDLE